jgi:PadR family transcriptional regulator, regulatory protein AphA
MRLKPSAYLILGMLRGGVVTGYAIKRAVDQSTRFFWATSFAQVYPELARLEEQGYIAGRDEPHGDRPRKTYRMTKKGERALTDWLQSSRVPAFEFRDEGLLRLFFADALPRDDAIALVKRLRQQAEEADRSFRENILPLAESAPEQGFRFPLDAARLGADYYAWRAGWFTQLEAELETTDRRKS